MIAKTFSFRRSQLAEAVRRTFGRRGTALPVDPPAGLSREFAAARAVQWRALLGRERMAAAPESLEVVVEDLRSFLIPLTAVSIDDLAWLPGGSWLVA